MSWDEKTAHSSGDNFTEMDLATERNASIAIVGMACRYPDARSPVELWENVLLQRRSFRRIPPERLRHEDYFSADRAILDHTYSFEAALIDGYEFDRFRYQVAGSTYRSVDIAHWLALDVASQALHDAGFGGGEGLPRESTGVLVGNTLTSEFSRANQMRLRWPYVRRVIGAQLLQQGWDDAKTHSFLDELEMQYKAPFTSCDQETLAGSLSNTIAGRVCNYFDLKGGGYTLDGACASSLLAVIQGCSAIASGDLELAVAGGVDLSLDPFELVGFARLGALAPGEMRVYDARSEGFLPGEGCGFVVLMPLEHAKVQGRRVYAVIRGWGISSDGRGGITRPETEGQLLALKRAYRRAGFGIDTVEYFEGHGTGTSVGDRTELEALSRALREMKPKQTPTAIGSIKANIGHTKAAAGIAGLIKASLAIHNQIIPPTAGTTDVISELKGENPVLRVPISGELWPADRPLRAGVSAMGFGGINSHVVLEGISATRRAELDERERTILLSAQDAELILLAAKDTDELREKVEKLLRTVHGLSIAQLADLSVFHAGVLPKDCFEVRAAIVAGTPTEIEHAATEILSFLEGRAGKPRGPDMFLNSCPAPGKVGFVFPGHGVPLHADGGALQRRFACVQELYDRRVVNCASNSLTRPDEVQPALGLLSLAALRVLEDLGVCARVAVGHSLGEIVALHWAGAFDDHTLQRVLSARGKAFGEISGPKGAMGVVEAPKAVVEKLISNSPVVIAALNSPAQTIVAGENTAVEACIGSARAQGLRARRLLVPFAFHSPLVGPAAPKFAQSLRTESLCPLGRSVASTVTGEMLLPNCDLISLLARQITSPVRFMDAVRAAEVEGIDLWIEVGSGRSLREPLCQLTKAPVVSIEAGSNSIRGLLRALGACFAMGVPARYHQLFSDRVVRAFQPDTTPIFLINPCERAPILTRDQSKIAQGCGTAREQEPATETNADAPREVSSLELVRRLVAHRTELPLIRDSDRLLSDLHLNSITVGEIISEAAKRCQLPPPLALTEYADASVAEIATALEDLQKTSGQMLQNPDSEFPPGVDSWVRPFCMELQERPLGSPRPREQGDKAPWLIIGSPEDPFLQPLRSAFSSPQAGGGVLVCLNEGFDERHVDLLMEGARAALSPKKASRFVLVRRGQCNVGASVARCLHCEAPTVATCVVSVPSELEGAEKLVFAEALAAAGFIEAHYDTSGVRREPVLRPLSLRPCLDKPALTPTDVLLVTGGGKGITAECALAIARDSGTSLLIVGRSDPAIDEKLAANLNRFREVGIRFLYRAADVTSLAAISAAIRSAEPELGQVTAILHGAAVNKPSLLSILDKRSVAQATAPKVDGLRNLLASVDPERLRLLIAFSSLTARFGLEGESHYALANEWMSFLVEGWQSSHSHCRCVSIEWSAWSGLGMGEYLGKVGSLLQKGIAPISPEEGIQLIRQLLQSCFERVAVVASGRMGKSTTLKLEQRELPLLRFLEQVRVYYPGVELVADAEISLDTDPYLGDHILERERVFPAVMGLEAMAQAARALHGPSSKFLLEHVQFKRPVVLGEGGRAIIRVAAIVRDDQCVEVVLRSDKSAFQVDHFCATFRLLCDENGQRVGSPVERSSRPETSEGTQLNADDLYSSILFQSGRFRRLAGYDCLRARECSARIACDSSRDWFSGFLPPSLELGDPGARDAVIHAIQACIPYSRIIPLGVERLETIGLSNSESYFVHARERQQAGDTYLYDIEVFDSKGRLCECWEKLCLTKISDIRPHRGWPALLLGPMLERRLNDFVPAHCVGVAVEWREGELSRNHTNRLIQVAMRSNERVFRRPDGKPVTESGSYVSVSHLSNLTLSVAGSAPVGCDLQSVLARSQKSWLELLGPAKSDLAGQIAFGEQFDVAATRVWSALECVKKAGGNLDTPLVFDKGGEDGWVVMKAGKSTIVSFAARIREPGALFVAAVLVDTTQGAQSPTQG